MSGPPSPNTLTDVPLAGNTLAHDQPLMRENTAYIMNTLGTNIVATRDHNITYNTADNLPGAGRHNMVGFLDHGNQIYPNDSVDAYVFSTGGQIWCGNSTTGATPLQLTRVSTVTNFGVNTNNYTPQSGGGPVGVNYTAGWTFLPGGLLFQYGTATIATGTTTTIKFPATFSSSVFSMQATGLTSGSPTNTVVIRNTPTTTSFVVFNASNSMTQCYWTAIGK